jgi:hypothetical protein
LHNLLARVFPEFATLASDLQAAWVLQLFDAYPTPAQLARAQLSSLTKIPYLTLDKAQQIQTAAKASVASLTGDTAAALVRQLVAQLRHTAATETQLKKLMAEAYHRLTDANHLESIPGIGIATAAVLTAKMVDCQRFATPAQLISYFGVFPEQDASGLDQQGQFKPGRLKHMSRKGNDLVRKYLWNAAKSAIRHNPAVKTLYQRLRARGARGDVALGHCMRKLLQLVWAVWKTGKPFDPQHYPWQIAKKATEGDKKTAGHKQELSPERKVVTTVDSSIKLPPAENNREPLAPDLVPPTPGSVSIDFAALRAQVSMEQVLAHLGCFNRLRGTGPQRRGSCPIHNADNTRQRSFSVHLGKKVFQCFHPPCGAKGNVLDLWAAVHRLPLHQAAVHLAQTFNITLQTDGETKKRNP